MVPIEACHCTGLRSIEAACYPVPGGRGLVGDDPVGQAGGLVREVWSDGWLRLAPFSSTITWRAVRDPPQGQTGDVRQHDLSVYPGVDSLVDGGGPWGRGLGSII